MSAFSRRSDALEQIDVPQPRDAWERALVFLRRINRFLGGTRAVLWHFRRWSRTWRPGERIEILDAGCGAGDIPLALALWGRRAGFDLRIFALDPCPECVRAAARDTAGRVVVLRGDALRPPLRAVDYVTASLLFHHLDDDRCLRALQEFDGIARRGIVVNDLLRRRRAWLWATALGALHGGLVRTDAPLSVLRGFSKAEARTLAARAGLPWLHVHEFFGHRFTLSGERP